MKTHLLVLFIFCLGLPGCQPAPSVMPELSPTVWVCNESGTILAPYVESNYRVLTDRQYHAVAGGSRGGIGAYRLAFQHPEQFASAGLFGSGVVPGEEDQVRLWLQSIPDAERPRVFLNIGFEDSLMLAQAKVMITLLDDAGFESTSLFTSGEHSYAYWVSNLGAYFQWVAQDWK